MTQTDSPQIKALKERYKDSFSEKINDLEECLHAVQSESATHEDVIKLRDLLHKIAGSSGMYGYNDISVLSRASMNLAERIENLNEIEDLSLNVKQLISLFNSNR